MRRAAILLSTISIVALAQPSRRAPIFPIAVTIARVDGTPVVDRAWIDDEVRNVNAIYEAHHVRFRITSRLSMPARHAQLESREDRHALGALMRPEVINVFVVASLRDVDDPTRYRQGVHWRPRGHDAPSGAHFVIVSAIAGPHVLAHELGHFFGNRHSDVPGNLMSYERGEGPPVFDAIQSRRVQSRARELIESRELVPIGARSRQVGDVDESAERNAH